MWNFTFLVPDVDTVKAWEEVNFKVISSYFADKATVPPINRCCQRLCAVLQHSGQVCFLDLKELNDATNRALQNGFHFLLVSSFLRILLPKSSITKRLLGLMA